MKIKDLIKNNEYRIALVVGYALVASLAFGLGQLSVRNTKVTRELPSNYTGNVSGAQTASTATEAAASTDACQGKIKGSASMLYHVPGGAFYDKTTHPIKCFDTEQEAQAAGFKKSSR